MFDKLIEILKANPRKIVFTEGSDARILEAASRLKKDGFLTPVLVGNVEEVKAAAAKGGFDIEMLRNVCGNAGVPVIASGGAGGVEDFVTLFREAPFVDAGLAASIFHFREVEIPALKDNLAEAGVNVRRVRK